MPFKYPDMKARIMANTVRGVTSYNRSRCWMWKGSLVGGQYGRYGKIMVRAETKRYAEPHRRLKTMYAHRLSFMVFNNVLLEAGAKVLHLCNVPLCVNPKHLKNGTQSENVQQCVREGRHVAPNRKAA